MWVVKTNRSRTLPRPQHAARSQLDSRRRVEPAHEALGPPLHRLLAPTSTATASAPAYASLLRYGDADLVAAAAADAISRGHRAVKLHEATVETVASAREAIGAEVSLTLDVNCRWSVDESIANARSLKPFDLDWIEEPCWPPEPEHLARIGAESGVPMAAGENAGSLAGLERIATVGKATYIQPSAAKIGGVSGLLAARDIAARHGIKLATHSAYFGPALAGADVVVLTDIYPAGEAPIPGVTIAALADAVRPSVAELHVAPRLDDVPATVAGLARAGDLIVTLGAGSIGAASTRIVDALGEEAAGS